MEKIVRMDERIASFYRQNKRRFAASLMLHFAGKILNAFEFYLVFLYLGFEIGFVYALCINSLSIIINTLFIFVPGHWGIAEGGQAFIFLTLGLNPADGISVGVIRRVRHIFFTLIGLALFYMSKPGSLRKPPLSNNDYGKEGVKDETGQIQA
jgi:uncharacterized protein (TIRG00374 family)